MQISYVQIQGHNETKNLLYRYNDDWTSELPSLYNKQNASKQNRRFIEVRFNFDHRKIQVHNYYIIYSIINHSFFLHLTGKFLGSTPAFCIFNEKSTTSYPWVKRLSDTTSTPGIRYFSIVASVIPPLASIKTLG